MFLESWVAVVTLDIQRTKLLWVARVCASKGDICFVIAGLFNGCKLFPFQAFGVLAMMCSDVVSFPW